MEFTELIKAIILGIIEGITEFLPISSTGHLIVASEFLDFMPDLRDTFNIFIQLGAVLAVVAYYAKDIKQQVVEVRTSPQVQQFWLAIIVACVPFIIVGLTLHDFITDVLFSPVVVAISLIVGGFFIIFIERRLPAEAADTTIVTPSLRQAFLIGLSQCLAVIPGVSRSAASIIGGIVFGINRTSATRFSFFLAMPTLGGATIYDLLRNLDELSTNDLGYLLVGTVVAGIVAWFAVSWLLRYIARNNFTNFGWYRIFAGIVVLAWSFFMQ